MGLGALGPGVSDRGSTKLPGAVDVVACKPAALVGWVVISLSKSKFLLVVPVDKRR